MPSLALTVLFVIGAVNASRNWGPDVDNPSILHRLAQNERSARIAEMKFKAKVQEVSKSPPAHCDSVFSFQYGLTNDYCASLCRTSNPHFNWYCREFDENNNSAESPPSLDSTSYTTETTVSVSSETETDRHRKHHHHGPGGPNGVFNRETKLGFNGCFSQVTLGHPRKAARINSGDDVLQATTFLDCQTECQHHPDCSAFQWNRETEVCLLLSGKYVADAVSAPADVYANESLSSLLRAGSTSEVAEVCDKNLVSPCVRDPDLCLHCNGTARCVVHSSSWVSGPVYCPKHDHHQSWCDDMPRMFIDDHPFSHLEAGRGCDNSVEVLLLLEQAESLKPILDSLPYTLGFLAPALQRLDPDFDVSLGVATFDATKCYELVDPVSRDFESSFRVLESATVREKSVEGSPDYLNAISQAAIGGNWSSNENSHRIIILVAGAVQTTGVPMNLQEWLDYDQESPIPAQVDLRYRCENKLDTHPKTLRKILKESSRNTHLIVLSPVGRPLHYFKWLSDFIGQSPRYVQAIDERGSNGIIALGAALRSLSRHCNENRPNHG